MRIAPSDVTGRLGVDDFKSTTLARSLSRLPAISKEGPWIAGGAVRRTFTGEKLDSDFDFFFANEAQATTFKDALRAKGAKQSAETEKAFTFILPTEMPEDGVYLPEMKIQAIQFAYFADAESLIDSFDFTISQFAYDGESLHVAPFALWDVARRRLVVHRVTYAVSTMRRLLKYTAQGYTVCPGALSEILKQVIQDPGVIHAETQYID